MDVDRGGLDVVHLPNKFISEKPVNALNVHPSNPPPTFFELLPFCITFFVTAQKVEVDRGG